MTNKTITDLTAASALDGSERIVVTQGGNSRGAALEKIDTLPVIAAMREQVSITQAIGYPLEPVPAGDGTTGNNVFVFGVPASKDSALRRVRTHSPSGGTMYVSVWDKAGDDFTFVEEVEVTLASGDQTINLNISVEAGQYVGFYCNGGVSWQTGSTADSGGWYVTGTHNTTTFTDAATTTTTRLHLRFDLEAVDRVDELEADLTLKAAQADVTAIEADVYTTKTLNIGTTGTMTSGGGDIDGALYALEQSCQQDGAVSEVRLFTEASGDVRVMVFSKSGNTFTVEEEVTVSATGGYEAFSISLPILAGQYVGVQSTNVSRTLGVTDTFGWYAGAGSDSFTDSTTTRTTRLHVGFSVEYQETSFAGASRPASVDLPFENMLIVGMGQSLWEGSDGDVTTTVEYDSKGFPAYPATPNAIADATVANTERATSRGEWPGLGAAASIRAAILRDNNIAYTDLKNTVVVANNAVGGKRIDEIDKGNAPFASAVAQAGALAGITGESSGVLGVTFGQGESDSQQATDSATYLAALIQLAEDADADMRAATGQSKRIPFVTYQMNATGRDIGLMHLQASIDSPLIYCAGPMYQYEYYDTLHIDAASSRLVGALHGEVIKRVAIDGEDWEPLRPVDAKVLGNAITLTFNKSGLVLDSTLLAGQTNSGFVVKNDSGTAQTVSAVEVLNGNQVRLTCATTPASDWTVEYGVSASGRSDSFGGLMGNLRDNAGAERVFDGEPIHNWCVVFDWTL